MNILNKKKASTVIYGMIDKPPFHELLNKKNPEFSELENSG
jgi:hypothetical protein